VKILLPVERGADEFVRSCREAGADGVFTKPLEVGKLRDRVAALLGRRKPIVIHTGGACADGEAFAIFWRRPVMIKQPGALWRRRRWTISTSLGA
jgi:DNA-binding response OmpR family regulator